ncbi:uncharacterized protein ACLA_092300 [Aspergillus clavatus NRRL 1]|uniref:Microbial-type PARG catalytic domain-containing protein n=1 Tax=Aspergillus clavatus (strain ATCC 1007 / CBS 513.65 / DSM 816 / NCTC 3887 / NRRL 1 / QM 1276 / 107) TaxID=344612 RepID=A1CF83_ASPCL|nr:uncharacterized protein ACLA_092300 [Aspergillus clavatus NRRL 1]EAW11532.1 conserved hypothetical protein [Aspergillus clavatus NRRL 1]
MTTPKPPNNLQRQHIAAETHALTPYVIAATTGASLLSHAHLHLLPRLSTSNASNASNTAAAPRPRITITNQDSFTAARAIQQRTQGQARVGVLNMASEKRAGGGWLSGALAQEEALCLRSTLAATLAARYYPLPVYGAVWSPGVVVFRGEVGTGCEFLRDEEKFVVGVVSLAALRRPVLTGDGRRFANVSDVFILKNKMRQVLRVLANKGITHCVLGAMGCGAFRNPPYEVARIYKEVLEEDEWTGGFEEIVFAVLDTKGESNYTIFKNVLLSLDSRR